MSGTNQMKIGNENFKTWLKKLDPLSRVEEMRAIAKTQASNGLKGSLIKASLAQLSQRCQVMLVKLSEKDIKRYTRRKSVKRLVNNIITTTKEAEVSTYRLHYDNVSKHILKDEQPKEKKAHNCVNDRLHDAHAHGYQTSTLKPGAKENISIPVSTPANVLNDCNKKLKRKYQELFGDDFDDVSVVKNGQDTCTDLVSNTNDKQINNYLSTKVEVNIYSSGAIKGKTDNTLVQTKIHKENSLLGTEEPSNKSLRIDVSLSGGKETDVRDNLIFCTNSSSSDRDFTGKIHKDKSKHRSKNSHSKRPSETSKHKQKSSPHKSKKISMPPLNIANNPEDDPSIKELWSILGMESPTDRSERTRNNLMTLQKPPMEKNQNDLVTTLAIDSTEKVIEHNVDITEKEQPTNNKDNSQITVENVMQTSSSENCCEPVCKIADTFSLAVTQPKGFDSFGAEISVDKSVPNSDITNIKPCTVNTNEGESVQDNHSDVDTITVLDDDEEEQLVSARDTVIIKGEGCEKNKEKDKIGTIRVKGMELLMNPELIPGTSSTNEKHDKLISSELQTETVAKSVKSVTIMKSTTCYRKSPEQQASEHSSVTKDPPSVEERFFATYKYYFDELVTLKIPKLGELLHLAVADKIRRSERIKRAEKLSSDDLILEEKQRAEKDFNDMMKTRGSEFSPLCEFILNRFDKSSKITLFIALFCRILKHAEQIDPSNNSYVLEARNVVYVMLSKHQFKDKEVLESLTSDPGNFAEQVKLISALIEKCFNDGTRSNQRELPKTNSVQDNTVIPSSECTTSNPINTTPKPNIIPKTLGTQNAIPQRKKSIAFEDVALPNSVSQNNVNPSINTTTHSSVITSTGISNTVQTANTPISVAFVTIPQPGPITANPVTRTVIAEPKKASWRTTRKPIILAKRNITNPINLHTTNIINANLSNLTNPAVMSLNVLSTATALPQKPSQITPVSSANNLIQQLQTNNTTGITRQEHAQMLANRLVAELETANTAQGIAPFILREVACPSAPAIVGMDPQSISIFERHSENSRKGTSLLHTTLMGPKIDQSHLASKTSNNVNRNSTRVPIATGNQSGRFPVNTTALNIPLNNKDLSKHNVPATKSLNQTPRTVRGNHNGTLHIQQTEVNKDRRDLHSFVNSMIDGGIRNKPTPAVLNKNKQLASVPGDYINTALPSGIPSSAVNTPLHQNTVPSSSHCHPFVKRMPIGGKLRMLFGNFNSN